MPTLPVSNASPRRCPATHSLSTPWGTTRTLGCTNREGHAGPHVVARGNARPSERFTEYSVVHGVAWFNYTEHRSREVWTRCGRYFITSNRTRNNRAITCMRCMCR